MTNVLIIFLLIIIFLGILMAAAVMINHHKGENIDSQYINEENDHLYYDRSLIEKKEFRKNNPDAGEPRTFRRLLKGGKKQ